MTTMCATHEWLALLLLLLTRLNADGGPAAAVRYFSPTLPHTIALSLSHSIAHGVELSLPAHDTTLPARSGTTSRFIRVYAAVAAPVLIRTRSSMTRTGVCPAPPTAGSPRPSDQPHTTLTPPHT